MELINVLRKFKFLHFNMKKKYRCFFCGKEHVFTDTDNDEFLKRFWGFLALMLAALATGICGLFIFGSDSMPMLIIEFCCICMAAIGFIYLCTTLRRLPCYKLPTVPLIHLVLVGVPISLLSLFLVKDTAVLLSSDPATILSIHKFVFVMYIILSLLSFAVFFALIRKTRKEASRL